MQACQFFDDIDLALDIKAPARDVDKVSIFAARKHRKTETTENAADFKRAELFAENPVHFARVEFDRSEVKLPSDHVDYVANERAAAGFENQFGDPIGRRDGRFEIGSALKAVRSVGVNAVALRHTAHRNRVPPRGFDENIFRLLGDHGVEAAHHTGQPHRLPRVGNDEVFGGELALHAIQRLQRLARASLANDQTPSFEEIKIEHVRRFAALPQNVVGRVHRIADGALIEQP